MLRTFIISLSRVSWAQSAIMRSGLAWRAASRFVAGVEPEAAIQAARDVNDKNIAASLDHLGENTQQSSDAVQATISIFSILDQIRFSEVNSNVSIKLTQIGLGISTGLCKENLQKIIEKARENGIFIRLDMEESKYVDQTLALYKEMCHSGYENLGVVIQSYLFRSQSDLIELARFDAKVRLCKGAYKEPIERAFPKKGDVDQNYDRLAEQLLDRAKLTINSGISEISSFPPIPAIATHDLARIEHVKAYVEKIGLAREAFEFQMLYGIRSDLQARLSQEGYRVRVYIPFGTRWYPYLMRRLAERPANLWFFTSNFIHK